jgi:hypothetical protein
MSKKTHPCRMNLNITDNANTVRFRANSIKRFPKQSLFKRTLGKEATTVPRLRNWAHTSQRIKLPNVPSISI